MIVCDIKKNFMRSEYLGDGVYVAYNNTDDFTIFLSDGICTYSHVVLDKYVRKAIIGFMTSEGL